MDKQTAHKLISKTRDDYNLIADQFASTRRFNWGDFATALRSLPVKKGAKVLDLGCGNGRVYELLKDLGAEYYGLDISERLIEHAEKNVPLGHFTVGDMLKTPYQDNEFDIVMSAATLHHIPGKEARNQALTEMYRITKPGGQILVTIWYFWNKPFYIRSIIRNFWFQLQSISELDPGDFYMPWRDGSGKRITKRYFHAWRKLELTNALKKAGFTCIKASFFWKSNKKIGNNLIAIARKPK